jgi:hypothetical protein
MPSKATQYKFFSLYRFQQSGEGGSGKFERTVDELVRVLKIALALWGLSEPDDDEEGKEPEGLCTDKMIERLGKWRKMIKGLKREFCSPAMCAVANSVDRHRGGTFSYIRIRHSRINGRCVMSMRLE